MPLDREAMREYQRARRERLKVEPSVEPASEQKSSSDPQKCPSDPQIFPSDPQAPELEDQIFPATGPSNHPRGRMSPGVSPVTSMSQKQRDAILARINSKG